MLTGFKILLQADSAVTCSKFSLIMPQNLKYLAAVPYEFLVITVPVSNCCLFSDINILQGNVGTLLRYGGIFSYHCTANLLRNLTVKEF